MAYPTQATAKITEVISRLTSVIGALEMPCPIEYSLQGRRRHPDLAGPIGHTERALTITRRKMTQFWGRL